MLFSLAKNPEGALAELFNRDDDALSVNMHAMQREISSDRLLRTITNEMVTAINRSCVNINSVLALPHLAPSLQFVCGLGPRKAKALLLSLQTARAVNRTEVWRMMENSCVWALKFSFFSLSFFKQLLRPPFLGHVTHFNASGFLVFDPADDDVSATAKNFHRWT